MLQEEQDSGENRSTNHVEEETNLEDTPEEKETEDFVMGFDPDEDGVDYDDDGVVTLKKDDFDRLKKGINNAKTSIAKKRGWKEKYNKLSSKSMTQETKTQSNESKGEQQNRVSTENQPAATTAKEGVATQDLSRQVEIIKLTSSHNFLNQEAAERIVSTAERLNIPVAQALEDPLIKPYLEQKKKEFEVENASANNSSSSSSAVSGAEVKDWSTATDAEVREHQRELARRARR